MKNESSRAEHIRLPADPVLIEGVQVRRATEVDAALVESILREAAEWLTRRGIPLWLESELLPDDIARHAREGRYFIAEVEGEPAGTMRFEHDDPDFWPDVVQGESAFVHRLAVRRRFAGRGVAAALLAYAAERARASGCRFLRLDCDAARPRLKALYEGFGFRYHSDWQAGPFHVSRYQILLTEEAERDPGA
jgi:GNAT superfamily N-acetyltransferase